MDTKLTQNSFSQSFTVFHHNANKIKSNFALNWNVWQRDIHCVFTGNSYVKTRVWFSVYMLEHKLLYVIIQ